MTVSPNTVVTYERLSEVDVWQLLNTISNLGGTWPRFFVLNGKKIKTLMVLRSICSIVDSECA